MSKKFVVCDLSSIETRLTGWVANCPGILGVFEQGLDAYVDFAARILGKSYDEMNPDFPGISAEEKQTRKKIRQDYKPPVLGCGYGLGAGKEALDKNGDEIKTGLWGYSENMGVTLTQEFCQESVDFYRSEYREVCSAWRTLENAAVAAVRTGEKHTTNHVTFGAVKPGKLLYCILPSGRRLHYIRPRLEAQERWDGDAYVKLRYEGNIIGSHWGQIWTWGGKLIENVVQAIARDVLVSGMLRAKEAGFTICGHAHDEIICLEDVNGSLGLKQLRECMIARPAWALDLPLDADGFEDDKYRKG
jgi:DNA polymerase